MRFAFANCSVFQNKLINMYVKCGSLGNARKVFDEMTEQDIISWNMIIVAYRRYGHPHEALTLFHRMQQIGVQPDQFSFASILPACAKVRALEEGMHIHQSIIERGFFLDVVVANALVDMYAKCGNVHKAHELFDKMSQRDIISWNSLISGYVQNRIAKKALETFKKMQLTGMKPDSTTFASILPACGQMGDLEQGMDIHQSIIESGCLSDVVVASALMDMYAKCGSTQKARELFDKMPRRDLVSWNAMIAGYVQNGHFENALETFKQIQFAGVKPDSITFASILSACAKMGALEQGMNIHHSIIESRLLSDVVVTSALVDMYAKCGCIHKACTLFDKMSPRDVVSWNAMIAGYTQNGLFEKALETFKQMQLAGVEEDTTTFANILPACAKMRALEQGKGIHQSILEKGIWSDDIANALVNMYSKCGSIHKARELFDNIPQRNVVSWTAIIAGYAQNGDLVEALRLFKEMPQRNVVSWNAMIAGYAQNGFVDKALEIFKHMQLEGVKPVSTTFASILSACAKMGVLQRGMGIHPSIVKIGLLSNVVVASALVDMYAKCQSIYDAREIFDEMHQRDVVSWNAMIAGYAQNGFVEKALETFKQMQLAGVKPDSSTFVTIVRVCATMGALKQGINIHQRIVESNFLSDVVVASALVDMYAKCGSVRKAYELFDKMPQRDVVAWTAMVTGYAQNGFIEKALEIFRQMQLAGVNRDPTTFASILPACAKMGSLEQGINIHQSSIESGFSSDVVVASALVDMYAKCGSILRARKLFDRMPERNVISWNAMIAGYAHNGFSEDAFELFQLMKHSRTKPDRVSFICVLLACSHAGLVDEGCKYFNGLSDSCCIKPTIDHYVCMVDILGRAGYLEETLNFIIKMPIKPVEIVWMCLLGACRPHKNIGLGVFTANLLLDLDPKNATTYILLSNIYAEVGRWSEVEMIRRLMKDRGIEKMPGCSWIEGQKTAHAFCVGNRSNP